MMRRIVLTRVPPWRPWKSLHTLPSRQPRRRWGWLRAWGRLRSKVYLSQMFVVFALVRLYRLVDGDPRWGFLWYLPALPLCWLVGAAVERWLSLPCERWLRARLLRSDATTGAPVAVAVE